MLLSIPDLLSVLKLFENTHRIQLRDLIDVSLEIPLRPNIIRTLLRALHVQILQQLLDITPERSAILFVQSSPFLIRFHVVRDSPDHIPVNILDPIDAQFLLVRGRSNLGTDDATQQDHHQ